MGFDDVGQLPPYVECFDVLGRGADQIEKVIGRRSGESLDSLGPGVVQGAVDIGEGGPELDAALVGLREDGTAVSLMPDQLGEPPVGGVVRLRRTSLSILPPSGDRRRFAPLT